MDIGLSESQDSDPDKLKEQLENLKQELLAEKKEKQLIHKLGCTSSLDSLLEEIMLYLDDKWGIDAIGVQLVDETSEKLVYYKFYGVHVEQEVGKRLMQDVPLTRNISISAKVAMDQEAYYASSDKLTDLSILPDIDRKVVIELGIVENLIVPIIEDQNTIGVFHLMSLENALNLSEEKIEDITGFLNYITGNIEKEKRKEELEKHKEHLQLLVEELKAAKDAAESATKAKSMFLANMSHELRTPLNGVLGMISLLQETDINHEQEDYLDTANISGEALLALINDILDFSKIEAGKLELENIDFDVINLVSEVINIHRASAREKGLTLSLLADESIPHILNGDPTRIWQLINNLLSNAIKFTQFGGVDICIAKYGDESKEEKDSGRILLRFSVKDSGIGISKEIQEKIFESFSQADESTTRNYGGTGLGLAICKQLATLLGGEIGVVSEPGDGSEFWFTVRLGYSNTSISDESYGLLKGKKVALIENGDKSYLGTEKALLSWGMEVIRFRHPGVLVKEVDKLELDGEGVDLVLIDHVSSGENCLETIDFIRKHYEETAIKIVLISSCSRKADALEAHKAGVNVFLRRPVHPKHLYANIASLLGHNIPYTVSEKEQAFSIPPSANSCSGNKKLLIVEDNPVNQRVALGLLKQMGHNADIVENGIEAIEAVKNNSYDLILMDCQMPVMDGYSATKMIRDLEKHGTVKENTIIALTASVFKEDREKCADAGMNDHIPKPLRRNALAAILDKWLG